MQNDPTVERLLDSVDSRRIERRREYEAEQARRNNLFMGHDDFPPTASPRFIIDPLIPEGRLILLAGDPKCGKTALATAIALAVAKGEPFAGMPVQQGGVLWLSCEESFGERSELLRIAPKTKVSLPLYTCYENLPIDTESAEYDIQFWKCQVDAKLLVVDPLHGAHSGRSLHDGWAARRTLRLIKRICGASDLTAIVIHHLTKRAKEARVAESVQLAAIASTVITLSRSTEARPFRLHEARGSGEVKKRQTDLSEVTLECRGRGLHANATYVFRSNGPLDYELVEPTTQTRADNTIQKILSALEFAPLTADQIADRTGMVTGSVRNVLTRLVALKSVIPAAKSGRKTQYVLNEKTPP